MRAALRTFVAVAAVVLLILGLGQHAPHFTPLLAAPGGPIAPAAEMPSGTLPAPLPEDTDQDGCPKPGGNPCSAGWAKPPPPPPRHGGHSSQRHRAAGKAGSPSELSGVCSSALRWTLPAGPRLTVFRC
ncbi:hypothetical protein GCM10022226_54080 [Sphaerisporangium flaviroseum]|uniref:Uncharacterized protein n=1 Tax=Sphaerisporangium flaviroseum TaxID=509199 RepID=A0ABP7IUG3_9ACTN